MGLSPPAASASAMRQLLPYLQFQDWAMMWFVCFQAEQIRNLIEALFIESDEVRIFLFRAIIF